MEKRNIILLGGGLAVGYYLYTYHRASKIITNTMYTFDDIFLVGYESGAVVFGVRINARSTGNLVLSNINLNLYCNSQRLGRLVLPYRQQLVKGETTLMFNLYIQPKDFTKEVLSILTTNKITFAISGSVSFNGLPIRFPSLLVAQDSLTNLLEQYILPNAPYIGKIGDVDIEKYSDGQKVFYKNGYSSDIINACCLTLNKYREQTKEVAESLKNQTTADSDAIYLLVCYMLNNFHYKVDPAGEQLIKSPSRFKADGIGDCKAYSIFICSVLSNMGIDNFLRFVDYGADDYTHVYSVAKIKGCYVPIDVVALIEKGTDIGEEIPYRRAKDVCYYTEKLTNVII